MIVENLNMPFEKYKNLSGRGGIIAFEVLEKAIILQFANNDKYLYDYMKPGKINVENLKRLTRKGIGLTTYINQKIRGEYRRKLN
jgi:hypothetical protein